jgi:lactoylglutathione lyase
MTFDSGLRLNWHGTRPRPGPKGLETGESYDQQSGLAVTGWSRQPIHIGAITLFVEHLAEAKRFYGTVFQLPVHFEDENSAVFRFGDTLINLLDVAVAGQLIDPATAAPPDGGERCQFTIGVDDVDAACAELARLGVTLLNGPMNRPWGIRTASFTAPGGHIWELAQDLP